MNLLTFSWALKGGEKHLIIAIDVIGKEVANRYFPFGLVGPKIALQLPRKLLCYLNVAHIASCRMDARNLLRNFPLTVFFSP